MKYKKNNQILNWPTEAILITSNVVSVLAITLKVACVSTEQISNVVFSQGSVTHTLKCTDDTVIGITTAVFIPQPADDSSDDEDIKDTANSDECSFPYDQSDLLKLYSACSGKLECTYKIKGERNVYGCGNTVKLAVRSKIVFKCYPNGM